MKVYKIYNPETGLYSKGGVYPSSLWSKDGKAWTLVGLKAHLRVFFKKPKITVEAASIAELYKTCVIHEFESDPVELDINDFFD